MNLCKTNIRNASAAALLALAMLSSTGTALAGSMADPVGHANQGKRPVSEKWMAGDFHQHTYFTDGSHPMNDLDAAGVPAVSARAVPWRKGVMPEGFRNGLDFQANSEHGGIRNRDGFGSSWDSYVPSPVIGDGASPTQTKMWRWQSLISPADIPGYSGPPYMGAYDWILGIRANYPDKIVMTGMEWNPPGHEHCSTGIAGSDAKPIAEFEYRFDRADTDGTTTSTTAETMGWEGKRQNVSYTTPDYSAVLGLNAQHEKTLDAVRWMQANHPSTGWIIPAHVERAGCGVNAWSIASFRDINDAGPDVAFGFEGIPGHEKAANRGEFGTGSCGGGTYGGAGIYIAQVGGVWDNLLSEGRRFFNFASSDFHNDEGADFWPGEYLKTYVKVRDLNHDGSYSQEEVVAGLRSGNAFSVHGDLISDLDFRIFRGAPFGKSSATMGEILPVRKGDKITVQIRFRSPGTNNCSPGKNASANYVCADPVVHHVQLIQGDIKKQRPTKLLSDGVTPNPDYNAIDGSVARIVRTFDAASWKTDAEGFTTMTFTVPKVEKDMFFRIRGTNLGYNVTRMDASGTKIVYGTDAAGSPLINTPGTNNADMAWDDLWFYSNPIFVKIR